MKCPKCKEEITDGVKFCTKCGANIEEEKQKIAEAEAKKKAEAEKRKKAAEDKKRLEEIRKQEELKKEQELKEAEKQEAIRKAKEEGIELEIIDKEPEIPEDQKSDFKVKKEEEPKTKAKKKKVKIKKNIFQRILNKLLLIIVIIAIIIGGVYYCYKQELLPEFAQKEVKDFDSKLQNVINLYKDVKEGEKNLPTNTETNYNTSENWKVNPNIEADDIRDLTSDVSVIVKNKKEGLIDNQSGDIVLEAKYSQILYTEYYEVGKTEAEKETGIVVKDSEKFYKLDKDYNVQAEVTTIAPKDSGTYFYDHHGPAIYYNSAEQICTLVKAESNSKGLKACTDIDLVTTDGAAAKDTVLPESFSIDFSKSKAGTKGYFDVTTGDLKINCDFDETYEFSEGYAAVKKENTAGIIDEDGKTIVDFKYTGTRSVHNNSAFVMKDGKWGILKIEK